MDDALLLRALRLLVFLLVLAFIFRHNSSSPTMVKPEDVPRIKLNNGKEIPVTGLGMLTILGLAYCGCLSLRACRNMAVVSGSGHLRRCVRSERGRISPYRLRFRRLLVAL